MMRRLLLLVAVFIVSFVLLGIGRSTSGSAPPTGGIVLRAANSRNPEADLMRAEDRELAIGRTAPDDQHTLAPNQTVIYEEYWETGLQNWEVGDLDSGHGADYWDDDSDDDARAYSGWAIHCADCQEGTCVDTPQTYDDDMQAYACRLIDLSDWYDGDSIEISFYLWYHTEQNYDWFNFRASRERCILGGMDLLFGYSGGPQGWYRQTWDLSSYADASALCICFEFVSDWSINSYEGAYVDDLLITGEHAALPPPPPTNIQASDGVYSSKVLVTWEERPDTLYSRVYRATTPDGTRTQIGTTGATHWDDLSAEACRGYYYWVKSCNAYGCSDFSAYDVGTRSGTTAPPSSIQASDGDYTEKVLVTWSSVSGALLYKVYRAASLNGTKDVVCATGTTSCDDTSASEGSIYYYWVRAFSVCGWSDFSEYDTGYRSPSNSPPSIPTNTQTSDSTYTDKVRVTWNSSSGATNYVVYRATSSGGSKTLLDSPGGTSYDDTSAAVGTTYYYWVKACNSYGCSDYSAHDTGYRGSGGDAYEDDDSWDRANWIHDGLAQTHSIVPVADVDWVRFLLSTEAEVVLETSGAGGDTRMWLYDSSLDLLEYNDDGEGVLFSRIDRLCNLDSLPPGTYYVRVDEYGGDQEIQAYDIAFNIMQACSEEDDYLTYLPVVIRDSTSGPPP
jgi:fibronectin type 3 domain-containing protein